MNEKDQQDYEHIRSGGAGSFEQRRGLIAVWGKEAIPFLDGMITNDMKTLEDGQQMLAAFPNAQGRLLAVVRVMRQGERFLFETEEVTREKLFNSLFRFTFAGDFFVEDVSENYKFCETWNFGLPSSDSVLRFDGRGFSTWAIPNEDWAGFGDAIADRPHFRISDEVYETLRVEVGMPKYSVNMDENTIVPELGLDDLISYTKGCYIGQEIIARIHFRGHVAKQLTGLVLNGPRTFLSAEDADRNVRGPIELTTQDGKNAGRITSVTYSPKLESMIALAFVRYDHLAEGSVLVADGASATVTKLPFID